MRHGAKKARCGVVRFNRNARNGVVAAVKAGAEAAGTRNGRLLAYAAKGGIRAPLVLAVRNIKLLRERAVLRCVFVIVVIQAECVQLARRAHIHGRGIIRHFVVDGYRFGKVRVKVVLRLAGAVIHRNFLIEIGGAAKIRVYGAHGKRHQIVRYPVVCYFI